MEPELVEIYRSNRMDAEIVRALLEDGGIETMFTVPGTSAAYPMGVGTLGEGRVLVRRADEPAARELIAAALEDPGEPHTESP